MKIALGLPGLMPGTLFPKPPNPKARSPATLLHHEDVGFSKPVLAPMPGLS